MSSQSINIVVLPFFRHFHLVCPTDAFDFSDDSSPGGTEGHKGRSGKHGDKSKDISGLKKIFSGPKKVLEHARNCLCVLLSAFT